ncbi:hypothetical protein KC19_VG264600 [Ceratodon purpureus]|uniref:Ribonuclease H1 N-terminal domain-containing protein n=1 Tax=Ceratodon purpureus TaxID=3225 RepID=A0A8T0HVI1_CERPU|nr:hypothetical protein KC19_VG264600 [Ceratodon purpureus]
MLTPPLKPAKECRFAVLFTVSCDCRGFESVDAICLSEMNEHGWSRCVNALLTLVWAAAIVVRGVCNRIIESAEVVFAHRQEDGLETSAEQYEEAKRASFERQHRVLPCAGEGAWARSSFDEASSGSRRISRKTRLDVRLPKYYSVRRGRSIGIYKSSGECREQVLGFRGSEFKSFRSLVEAKEYLRLVSFAEDRKG